MPKSILMQSAVFKYALQPIFYIFLLLDDLFILHPWMNDLLASAEAANCKVPSCNTQVMASCKCPSVHPFLSTYYCHNNK